jgi:hypothetical protein
VLLGRSNGFKIWHIACSTSLNRAHFGNDNFLSLVACYKKICEPNLIGSSRQLCATLMWKSSFVATFWKQELNQMIKWNGVSFFNDDLKMFKKFVCLKKDENQSFFVNVSWLVTFDLSLFIHFNSFFKIFF